MGSKVSLTASDGHELGAYLAPPRGARRGGLVIMHEAFGVNDYIRMTVDQYAAEGYETIAPAIYDRQRRDAECHYSGDDLMQARTLRRGLDWDLVTADVGAAVKAVTADGKVGIVGYCVGGSIAWLAGHRLPVAAAVSYYGRDIVNMLDEEPRCPCLLHFGDRDHHIPLSDVEKITAAYPELAIQIFPAEHGFSREGSSSYEPKSAGIARTRTLALLRKFVG